MTHKLTSNLLKAIININKKKKIDKDLNCDWVLANKKLSTITTTTTTIGLSIDLNHTTHTHAH